MDNLTLMGDVLGALTARSDKYSWTVRRRFNALPEDVREVVERRYRRHVRACESNGIEPDTSYWIAEAIDEAGREQEAVSGENE